MPESFATHQDELDVNEGKSMINVHKFPEKVIPHY